MSARPHRRALPLHPRRLSAMRAAVCTSYHAPQHSISRDCVVAQYRRRKGVPASRLQATPRGKDVGLARHGPAAPESARSSPIAAVMRVSIDAEDISRSAFDAKSAVGATWVFTIA